jgi:diguanylate cyclase (GGDEF)-like protein/PAS domain S-box-containing protein
VTGVRGASVEPVRIAAVHDWRLVLDAVPEGVAVVAAGGTIVFANRCLRELTGYLPGALDGWSISRLVPACSRRRHAGFMRDFCEAPRFCFMPATGCDTRCLRADGSTFAVDIAIAPLTLGDEQYALYTVSDDSERRELAQRLFYEVAHDPLTGLANRSLLSDRLELAARLADRVDTQVSALFIDLDSFKSINDRLGHDAGDAALCVVADVLVASARRGDTVARVGGDEFVVLGISLSGLQAERVAARILRALRVPLEGHAGVVEVHASIGLASAQTPEDLPALLRRADAAMYRAKAAGGGCYAVADDD